MIDTPGLKVLIALESAGSVTAAAAELGYTPSAISQHLKRLERELAVPLTEKVGRGIVLTDAAMSLADDGKRILGQLEAATLRARGQTDAQALGRVRLASFSTAMRAWIAPMLTDLGERGQQLVVTELNPQEAVHAVTTGVSDLAVVHGWLGLDLTLPEGLASQEICQDIADLVVRRDHPLAAQASVTWSDLIDQPWVASHVGICREWLDRMFNQFASRPHFRFHTDDFTTQVALVEHTGVLALIPRLGRVPLPESIVSVPITDPEPTRTILAVWRKTMGHNPAIQQLVNALAARAG